MYKTVSHGHAFRIEQWEPKASEGTWVCCSRRRRSTGSGARGAYLRSRVANAIRTFLFVDEAEPAYRSRICESTRGSPAVVGGSQRVAGCCQVVAQGC